MTVRIVEILNTNSSLAFSDVVESSMFVVIERRGFVTWERPGLLPTVRPDTKMTCRRAECVRLLISAQAASEWSDEGRHRVGVERAAEGPTHLRPLSKAVALLLQQSLCECQGSFGYAEFCLASLRCSLEGRRKCA